MSYIQYYIFYYILNYINYRLPGEKGPRKGFDSHKACRVWSLECPCPVACWGSLSRQFPGLLPAASQKWILSVCQTSSTWNILAQSRSQKSCETFQTFQMAKKDTFLQRSLSSLQSLGLGEVQISLGRMFILLYRPIRKKPQIFFRLQYFLGQVAATLDFQKKSSYY